MRDCCRKILFGAWMGVVLLAFSGGTAWTGSPGELKSLVPPEHMDQAKSFINPFTPTEEFIANGKRLYDGKGWCAFCHGWEEGGSPSVRRRNVPPASSCQPISRMPPGRRPEVTGRSSGS
jgi:hypothetical protein